MSTLITNTLQGINTVKYDANTTAMTIDSSGRVSRSLIPGFQSSIKLKSNLDSSNSSFE